MRALPISDNALLPDCHSAQEGARPRNSSESESHSLSNAL